MSLSFTLPSGKLATRFYSGGKFFWQLPTVGTEEWVSLSDADVRALAALTSVETAHQDDQE